MSIRHSVAPIDRANYNIAVLRAIESLIGQIKQPEISGSDLAILLALIIEDLDGAIEDMNQQSRKFHAV